MRCAVPFRAKVVRPRPRAACPLEFVSLFGYLSVAAAYPRHLGRLLPATGSAFYPHVHEPLGTSFAAAFALFGTAFSSTASAQIVPLLVALPLRLPVNAGLTRPPESDGSAPAVR